MATTPSLIDIGSLTKIKTMMNLIDATLTKKTTAYFFQFSGFAVKSTRWACRPRRSCLDIKLFSKVRIVCGSMRSPAEFMENPRKVIVTRSSLKNK